MDMELVEFKSRSTEVSPSNTGTTTLHHTAIGSDNPQITRDTDTDIIKH